MTKIYLPHAEQFDSMNENLAKIANALCSNIDITSWAGIQKVVRVGVAPALIPVGTQLAVNHSVYGTHLYDVVAHNYFKSAHDESAHSMTLLCHDVVTSIPYDAQEAFYYADEGLSGGTYNFTHEKFGEWGAGTYQFTLGSSVPKGGHLVIAGDPSKSPLGRVEAYDSSGALCGEADIILGNGGTSLGTCGVELNHIHRSIYGSNNYKESAIRQYLNSSGDFSWKPQTKFDRSPSEYPQRGFLGGLDSELQLVIAEVIVPCVASNLYESPDSSVTKSTQYTVRDKVYLVSQKEITGNTLDTFEDGTSRFTYYESATSADLIKYQNGGAVNWRTRSPGTAAADRVRLITSDGSARYYGANHWVGIAPCFTIA